MVIDGEVERERFLFLLNFQFRREHFYVVELKTAFLSWNTLVSGHERDNA